MSIFNKKLGPFGLSIQSGGNSTNSNISRLICSTLLAGFVVMCGSAQAYNANVLVNPGAETGDLTGWDSIANRLHLCRFNQWDNSWFGGRIFWLIPANYVPTIQHHRQYHIYLSGLRRCQPARNGRPVLMPSVMLQIISKPGPMPTCKWFFTISNNVVVSPIPVPEQRWHIWIGFP